MFSNLYPAQQTEDYGPSFGRLSEELGELAESLRVFPAAPGYKRNPRRINPIYNGRKYAQRNLRHSL